MKRAVKRIIRRNGGRKAPFAFKDVRTDDDIMVTSRLLSVLSPMVSRDERLYNSSRSVNQESVVEPGVLKIPYRSFFPAPQNVQGALDSQTIGDALKWMSGQGFLHRVSRHTYSYELKYLAHAMLAGTGDKAYADGDRIIRVDNDGRGEDCVWFCLQPFWKTRFWKLACALAQRLDSESVMYNYIEDKRMYALDSLPELKEEDPENYREILQEDWNRPWFRKVIRDLNTKRDLRIEIDLLGLPDGELLAALNYIEHNCFRVFKQFNIPDAIVQAEGGDLMPECCIHPIIWGDGGETLTNYVEMDIDSSMGEMWYYYDVEETTVKDGVLKITNSEDLYAERVKLRSTLDRCLLLLQKLIKQEQFEKGKLTSIIK